MSGASKSVDPRPLYAKVRETLLDRIKSGVWSPGQLIPNEFDIAAELKVSQGTARKALDTLAADGLVVRRQGKGTYVVEHTPANMLFRFFHVYDAAGRQVLPDSPSVRPRVVAASSVQANALGLAADTPVIQIDRVRTRDGKPFSIEMIALPEAMFPGLSQAESVPNTLYDLFQKSYGILVARADDKLAAVIASAREAELLGLTVGAPLLRIERVTYDLAGTPVEWRLSLCHLDGMHYLSRLR
jgi:GntR family transcriptional regulator